MKKLISFALASILSFTLMSCSDKKPSDSSEGSSQADSVQDTQVTEEPTTLGTEATTEAPTESESEPESESAPESESESESEYLPSDDETAPALDLSTITADQPPSGHYVLNKDKELLHIVDNTLVKVDDNVQQLAEVSVLIDATVYIKEDTLRYVSEGELHDLTVNNPVDLKDIKLLQTNCINGIMIIDAKDQLWYGEMDHEEDSTESEVDFMMVASDVQDAVYAGGSSHDAFFYLKDGGLYKEEHVDDVSFTPGEELITAKDSGLTDLSISLDARTCLVKDEDNKVLFVSEDYDSEKKVKVWSFDELGTSEEPLMASSWTEDGKVHFMNPAASQSFDLYQYEGFEYEIMEFNSGDFSKITIPEATKLVSYHSTFEHNDVSGIITAQDDGSMKWINFDPELMEYAS